MAGDWVIQLGEAEGFFFLVFVHFPSSLKHPSPLKNTPYFKMNLDFGGA